jgi:hypothetical protein
VIVSLFVIDEGHAVTTGTLLRIGLKRSRTPFGLRVSEEVEALVREYFAEQNKKAKTYVFAETVIRDRERGCSILSLSSFSMLKPKSKRKLSSTGISRVSFLFPQVADVSPNPPGNHQDRRDPDQEIKAMKPGP